MEWFKSLEIPHILPSGPYKSLQILVHGIPIYPSEKYEFISWDDEIPNSNETIIHSCPNHQPNLGQSEVFFHLGKL